MTVHDECCYCSQAYNLADEHKSLVDISHFMIVHDECCYCSQAFDMPINAATARWLVSKMISVHSDHAQRPL
ncbi:MAG: hypothetical protein ACI3ZG_07965 [Candidatus Coprenecus sp.]